MKKLLKMTLFKKIFFIIFVGVFIIEACHVYLDYQNQLFQIIQTYIFDDEIEKQTAFFKETENMNQQEIIDFFDNEYKGLYGYHAIINIEKSDILSEKYSFQRFDKNILSILYQEDNLYEDYSVDLSKLSLQQFLQIDDTISTSYYKDVHQPVNVEIGGHINVFLNSEINEKEKTYDPTYLKINNEVIIDNGNKDNLKKAIVQGYESNHYLYESYSPKETAKLINYHNILENIQKSIKDRIEVGVKGVVREKYWIKDNDLYIVAETYLKDELSLIKVRCQQDCVDQILESTILTKMNVYRLALLILLVMSFLIAYILTKRIKKIDNVTQEIADNHFDIQLKEKPNDELGNLSKNINQMSYQLKQTIEQLNNEIEHVKKLESLRKDFINQFTHEMKTPLGIINGYGELIEDTKDDKERSKYIEIIYRETQRINQLIQSMLSLSRLEAGKVELKREEFDLEDSVTEIIDEYEVLFMKKNIVVEVNTVNTMIYGDKKLIETVIHNFLSNALKHTNNNGYIRLTIDSGLKIYNTGELIPEDQLENIWYTFVTHDQQGSGLGLAICQSILELHQYNYGVKNCQDGVEFYFCMKEFL